MKFLGAIVLGVALALSGCAGTISKISTAYSTVTDLSVPSTKLAVAAQTFDLAKVTAINYKIYCTPVPSPTGCDDTLIHKTLNPAIKSGTDARDQIKVFIKAHPGALGSKGLYDSVMSAVNIINTVTANFKDPTK